MGNIKKYPRRGTDRKSQKKLTCILEFEEVLMTKSLLMKRSDGFIISKLQRTSCNINKRDKHGLLPLHLAIDRTSVAVAHELIKLNADIDALDEYQYYTPLHIAVMSGNLEAVCMLLFYGADVTIPTRKNMTALMIALKMGNQEIAEALIHYYDDFSCVSSSDKTALDFAVCKRSPLATELIKAGADLNHCLDISTLIIHSLGYDDDGLFRLLWPKIDPVVLLDKRRPFLSTFLRRCKFPTTQLVDCLYLILSCTDAFAMVEHCNITHKSSLMCDTLVTCSKKKIQPSDRIAIVYLFMSLGASADILDLDFALELYGFREEAEAIICTNNLLPEDAVLQEVSSPVHTCIVALQENTTRLVFNSFKKQIESGCSQAQIMKDLRYFSMPSSMKKKLSDLSKRYHGDQEICDGFARIPDVPSLLEICRDEARRYVKSNYKVEKLHQFHDAVRNLNLPSVVKDVILFKSPVY